MLRHRSRHLPKRRRAYARFYGKFRSKTGETRGFEFQVRVSNRVSNRALYKLIVHTVGKMKYEKKLPYHRRRQTFPTFLTLFQTPWVPIRKILSYDMEMDYPEPFRRVF